MTATTDLDRLLASWLDTAGPRSLDDDALELALDRARKLPQRRGVQALVTGPATWPRRGLTLRVLPPAIRVTALAMLGAAALMASVVVGSQLLRATPIHPVPSGPPVIAPSGVETSPPSPVPPPPSVDPLAHGRYTPAPDLLTPRSDARAIRLIDDRVLIFGGVFEHTEVGELFDPATGAGVSVGVPPDVSSAVVLRDGRVLMVGSGPDSTKPGVSVLFDPVSGTIEPTGPQVVPRAGAGLAMLPDGRVLMVGGEPPHAELDEPASIQRSELFDPATDTWSATGSLHSNRISSRVPGPASLADGRVFVLTGLAPDTLPIGVAHAGSAAETYDPATGQWTRVFALDGTAQSAVDLGDPIGLPDGRVAFVGWKWPADGRLEPDRVGLWDPGTKAFGRTAVLPANVRSYVILDDGRLFFVGALDAFRTWSGILDPRTGGIVETGPTRAYGPEAVLLGDGRVLLVGGTTDGDLVATMGPDHRIPPDLTTMEYFR